MRLSVTLRVPGPPPGVGRLVSAFVSCLLRPVQQEVFIQAALKPDAVSRVPGTAATVVVKGAGASEATRCSDDGLSTLTLSYNSLSTEGTESCDIGATGTGT